MEDVLKEMIKTKQEFISSTTDYIEHLFHQWDKANTAFRARFEDDVSWRNRKQLENLLTHLDDKIGEMTLKRQRYLQEQIAQEQLLEDIINASEKAKEEWAFDNLQDSILSATTLADSDVFSVTSASDLDATLADATLSEAAFINATSDESVSVHATLADAAFSNATLAESPKNNGGYNNNYTCRACEANKNKTFSNVSVQTEEEHEQTVRVPTTMTHDQRAEQLFSSFRYLDSNRPFDLP